MAILTINEQRACMLVLCAISTKELHRVKEDAWEDTHPEEIAAIDAEFEADEDDKRYNRARRNATIKFFARKDVRRHIEKVTRTTRRNYGINVASTLGGFAAIAHTPMTQFGTWDDDGFRLRPSIELTPMEALCIKRIKPTKYGPELELEPKLMALRALGDYLKLFDQAPDRDGVPVALHLGIEPVPDQLPRDVTGGNGSNGSANK